VCRNQTVESLLNSLCDLHQACDIFQSIYHNALNAVDNLLHLDYDQFLSLVEALYLSTSGTESVSS
jgi:hypothetical protein